MRPTERDSLKKKVESLARQMQQASLERDETHERVAAMCKRLDPQGVYPPDAWGLRDLLLKLEAERDDLHVAVDLVCGALVDSGVTVPEDVMKYGDAVRRLATERKWAEKKMADLSADLEVATRAAQAEPDTVLAQLGQARNCIRAWEHSEEVVRKERDALRAKLVQVRSILEPHTWEDAGPRLWSDLLATTKPDGK